MRSPFIRGLSVGRTEWNYGVKVAGGTGATEEDCNDDDDDDAGGKVGTTSIWKAVLCHGRGTVVQCTRNTRYYQSGSSVFRNYLYQVVAGPK